jgi:hypothetical protein
MAINHRFHSGKSDSADVTLVNPSNWNDTHSFTTPSGISANSAGVLVGTDNGSSEITLSGIQATAGLQTLRRNLYNTAYEFTGAASLISSNYNFPTINPSGSLAAAPGNVITLAPVPLGINGTNTNHYVYIAGTGTPEVCLITGGTAISGAPSGTIIITCAGTHSAGFTLQSATAGIQEAIWATGGHGQVKVPPQAYTIYGKITVPGSYQVSLRGSGNYVTFLNTNGTTGDWVVFDTGAAAGVDFGDMTVQDLNGVGHSSGSMVKILNRPYGSVSNLSIFSAYDGLVVSDNSNAIYNNIFIGCVHYGLWITATIQSTGNYSNMLVGTNGAFAIAYRIDGQTAGLTFTGCSCGATINAATNYSVFISQSSSLVTNEICWSNSLIDGHGTGVQVQGYGSYINNSIIFTGNRINASLYGVVASGSMVGLRFIGNTIYGATAGVLWTDIKNSCLVGNHINGVTVAVNFSGGTLTNIIVRANVLGRDTACNYGLALADTLVNVQIGGNDITGTIAPVLFTATTGFILDGNNIGIDDQTGTVADAATLAFPPNLFFTLTGTGTAITAVSKLWAGRRGTFIATNAAPPTFNVGTTIGNTFTPVQNKLSSYFCDGTKTWFS